MRTFILLFCSTVFGFMPNNILSQNSKIKIEVDKTLVVDDVFELIMEQTDYKFIYPVNMFKDFPKVNLEKGVIRVNSLLEKSLTNGDFSFDVTNHNMIVIKKKYATINAQEIIVNGRVTDNSGESLPGLSVYATKDPATIRNNIIRGTSTDFDGTYKLNVRIGEFIVVSGIGYEPSQKIVVAGKTTYNFILKDKINELEEVIIVTGYEQISRERATGAYSAVPKRELKNTVTQTLGSVLQGIAPGIQIAEDADGKININDVVIRGVGSINSSSTPLIVVDGFPINGGFDTVNPNDIEKVTILRDAAAASIWGARAGNGVIVVVTKKASRKGLNVEFNTFIKMRPKLDLERNFPRADSRTTLALESTIWVPNGFGLLGFTSAFPPPNALTDINTVNTFGFTSYSHGARAYYDAYNGFITQAELNTKLDRLADIDSFNDIRKYLLTTPIQKQYNIALSTSGERSNTRISAVYNDNINAFINDIDNQILININNQYKISDWLTFNFNGMLDNSKSENSNIGFQTIQQINSYENLINPNGSYATVRHNIYDSKFLDFFGNTITNLPYDDITYNPLRDARGTESVSKETNFRVNTGFNIKILDGLVFKPSFQYEKFQTKTNTYRGPETSFVKFAVINGTDFDAFDPIAATIGSLHIPTGAILDDFTSKTISTIYRGLLNYNKTFKKHTITALAGIEKTSSTNKFTDGVFTYGFNRDDNTFKNPDFTPWTGLWDNESRIDNSKFFGQNDQRFISYFGNVGYTYNNKYTVTGSARSDGANFIVEDKSQRFNPMWSLGVSWNVKSESFLKDVNFINALKFRVTNGENGNLVGSVATKPTITIEPIPDRFSGVFNASLNSLGNPDLRWERINTLNIGTDFNILDNSLYGSIDVYNKHSKLLIATVDLPSTLGVNTGTFNVGEMTNKGIELNLSSNIKFSNNLSLTTNLVFSHNKSEVTKLKDIRIQPRGLATSNIPYVEGQPFHPLYAYEYGGMQTIASQPNPYPTVIGQNGVTYGFDESVNGEDGRDVLKYMGTSVAPTIVGWNNTFSYKGFTLSARMIGKFGHKFRRPTFRYLPERQLGYYHKDLVGLLAGNHEAMGLPELPIDWVPGADRWNEYVQSLNTLVEDAAHIRLRQIYFSYDLPNDVLKKIGISSFRLFAQAENLGNLWLANNHGIDPEYISGLTRAPEETFSLGVNFQF